MRSRSTHWRIVFFSSVSLLFIVYCAAFGGHVRLIMFVCGIILYEVINHTRVAQPGNWIALISLAVGVGTPLLPVEGNIGDAIRAALLFLLFFCLGQVLLSANDGWLVRWFSWKPMRWLGNMSYSYYLIHGLALKAYFLALDKFVPYSVHGAIFLLVALIVMFGLSTIPACLLFLLVERPVSLRPRASNPSPRPVIAKRRWRGDVTTQPRLGDGELGKGLPRGEANAWDN